MSTTSFRFQVSLRVLLIVGFAFSGVYILLNTYVWLVALWLFLGFFLSVFSLIRFVEKSNRELRYFLLSVAQGDFSNSYPYKKQDELNYAFNTLNEVLKNLRNDKASNLIYLQTVVEHIGTAIICFDQQNKITLHNRSANDLFQKDHLTTIKSISGISNDLERVIRELKSGDKELIKVNIGGNPFNLSIRATEFWLKEVYYKIVSFQDIRSELEVKELESWQKLIRVLTHEIKNSVIPISTLSDVIMQLIKEKEVSFQRIGEGESFADILGGIETIQTRSLGLANFVKTYDQLTKIPSPEIIRIEASELVERLLNLFKPEFEDKGIRINKQFEDGLAVWADPNLIDQVLVNILKNAIDALEDVPNPSIDIIINRGFEDLEISIQDNGAGISTEVMENIFVPFYTTKSSGSGIGLALSRQIMRVHKGSIRARSSQQGTTFTLSLPLNE